MVGGAAAGAGAGAGAWTKFDPESDEPESAVVTLFGARAFN